MSKTEKMNYTLFGYDSHFAETLRMLMRKNGTTQKQLAEFVGIRPQSLALYCSEETTPNGEKLLKIAEYYGVTVDYLLTGTVIENIPVYEMLGLSERSVQNVKLIKDGYFEDAPNMLSMLDSLLGDKDFYTTLEHAAEWIQNDNEDMRDYYEFKAMQGLQAYLFEFLSRKFD